MERSGQTYLAGGVDLGANVDAHAQVAFSPLPHVFVFGSGTAFMDGNQSDGVLRRKRGILGVGTYFSLSDRLTVDLSGGFGRARQSGNGAVGASGSAAFCFIVPIPGCATPSTRAEYGYTAATKEAFGQAALGYRASNGSRTAVVLRVTHARFRGVTTTPDALPSPSRDLFFEPSLLRRFAFTGPLHLDLQAGVSLPVYQGDWPRVENDALFQQSGLFFSLRVGAAPILW